MSYPFKLDKLKAFSIKQPWASLIIKDIKDIENRTWGIDNEKWFLVHSSKQYDIITSKTKPNIVENLKKIKWENYPTGVILGLIHVKNVESDCDIDKYFWATGPKCWHIDFVYEFDNPIHSKGALSFWSPNSFAMDKVKKELSNNNFFQSLYIYQFCKTLNTLYLNKQDRKAHKTCKDIVSTVYNNNKYNVPNKLELNILNNYYNYPKPTIKPSQPNPWDNTQGFIATPLYIKGADKFQHQLLEGANNWFHSYLKDSPELKKYNLTDIETLKNLMDSTWRNKNMTKDQNKAIRNAFNGGGNAQFQPYKGWRLSGFGIWTHIRGARFVYKKILPATLEIYKKLYNRPIKNKSLPHLIFKPPSEKSGELPPHNDHGTWNDMYSRCLLCDSTSQWIENYGIQMLTHIEGARKGQGGQTTILGPMDIPTYLIILQLIHPKTPHDELPEPTDGWGKEWYTASGPKFYKWYNKEVLVIINRIVKIIKKGDKPTNDNDKKWIEKLKVNNYYDTLVKKASKSKYQKIGKIKMLPSEPFNSSYVVAWPSGFIHGSDKTGLSPRLTLTIPYDSIGNKEKSKRGFNRLKLLADKNMNKVSQDSKPYENGIIHKATKTEVEIYPYFKHIYLKPKDMDEIEYLFDQDNVVSDKRSSKISELPEDLFNIMLSYLKKPCVKLTDSMIHNLSKHIHLTFTPHVFITHNYHKDKDNNNNCYYLYLFVGDIYEYRYDYDEPVDIEYDLKPSIYLPALKQEINNFLTTNYGIYTEITFEKTSEKIDLYTKAKYKDFSMLQNGKWLDKDVIETIYETDPDLVSGTYYKMTFSNMKKK